MPQIMHHPDDDDGEDDERCQVCDDGSWDDDDLIVFCEGDGCGIVVHQSCYGILKVPKGDTPWFCNACKQGAGEEDLVRVDTLVPNLLRRQLLTKTQNALLARPTPVPPPVPQECAMCLKTGGPMKQTNDGRWVHVICVMAFSQCSFGDERRMDHIHGVDYAIRECRHPVSARACSAASARLLAAPAAWRSTPPPPCHPCRAPDTPACLVCLVPSLPRRRGAAPCASAPRVPC